MSVGDFLGKYLAGRAAEAAEAPPRCSFEGCTRPGTELACGRKDGPDCDWYSYSHEALPYCAKHADVVSDDGSPEYTVSCPNCGCHFGVN